MTFPRKILLSIVLWAVFPTLAVIAHATILPDRVGEFSETATDQFEQSQNTSRFYKPPAIIGQRHEIDVGPVFGFGTPETRVWYGTGPQTGEARPVVVLLHESRRDGRSMLHMWRDLAKRQRLVLIAPNARNSKSWWSVTDGIGFLNAVLQDAAQTYAIDPDRIYLAGHSAGGVFAMKLANTGGGPWKAIVTHAGHARAFRLLPGIDPVPVHSFVGDQDPLFTVKSTRGALRTLAQGGHDTSLTVIPNHGHWYYGVGPRLAPLMWHRLQQSS